MAKEGQIGAAFLHVLAGEFERRGRHMRTCFKTAWQFPLLAVSRELEEGEATKFRYTPMNDFRLEIEISLSVCWKSRPARKAG